MLGRKYENYRYAPLPSNESSIRLLSVLSASPNNLTCSLRIAPTLDSEPYHCLSYTWGDPFGRTGVDASEERMICDGAVLTIQRNLFDGLVQLFNIATQHDKLAAIWVDAVCINQNDDAEKGNQIKMMHNIYAAAASVVIWLGPDEGNEGEVGGGDAAKIEVVANAMRAQFGSDKLPDLGDNEVLRSDDIPIIDAISMDAWQATGRISTREYWQRLWVWQEIIAAKSDPIVVCGRTMVRWEDLRLASYGQILLSKATYHGTLRPGMVTRNLPYQMAWWRDKYLEKGPEWMRQKFGRLVLQVNRNSYVCWDERDKIFAHVGLCQRPELGKVYAKAFQELYLRFWCEIMQRTKEVNFLTFVEDASARKIRPKARHDSTGTLVELPSWVPDLRCCLEPPSLWDDFQFNPEFNVSNGLTAIFPKWKKADSINGIEVNESRKQLRMWGYRFDVVRGCGETSTEANEQNAIPRIVTLWRDIARTIETSPYGPQTGVADAISASLAIGTETASEPSFPVSEEQKERAMLWLGHALARGRIFGHDNAYIQEQDILLHEFPDGQGKRLQSLLDQYAYTHRMHLKDAADKFRSTGDNVNHYEPFSVPASAFGMQPGDGSVGMAVKASGHWGLRRQRLFRTDEGWIGKGPESMVPGDEVWIVPGGEVPFVLRPNGEMFRYVGHCYVHGIMRGEASSRFCDVDMMEVILE